MAFLYSVKESDIKGSFRLLVKDISLFSAALLPFLGLIFWYNYYRFGSILETGYGVIAQRAGFDNFSLPLMEGLGGFLISPVKGFFYYSPFAILFFFSLKDFIKKHRDIALCFICIIVFYLLFLSRYISWHGDWAWGPRFIFVLTPFFIIPISTLLDSAMSSKKYFLRTIVIFIFIISFIIQLAAISVSLNKYFIDLHLKQKVEFAVAYGDGMQPIYMPQAEFYFKWRKTPIIAQFIFIKEIATKLKGYILSEPPESAIFAEEVKAQPYMNVFDFWWLYNFFIDRNYSGFIGVVLLLMIAVSCALRILKYTT